VEPDGSLGNHMVLLKHIRAFLFAAVALAAAAAPVLASQATLVTPGSPLPMTGLASFLNAAFLSIGSCNSGTSAPANGTGAAAFAGECWANTTSNPWVFSYTPDGVNWVEFGTLDAVNLIWTPYFGGASAVQASLPVTVTTSGGVVSVACPTCFATSSGGVIPMSSGGLGAALLPRNGILYTTPTGAKILPAPLGGGVLEWTVGGPQWLQSVLCASTPSALQYNNSGVPGCVAGWTSDGTNLVGSGTGGATINGITGLNLQGNGTNGFGLGSTGLVTLYNQQVNNGKTAYDVCALAGANGSGGGQVVLSTNNCGQVVPMSSGGTGSTLLPTPGAVFYSTALGAALLAPPVGGIDPILTFVNGAPVWRSAESYINTFTSSLAGLVPASGGGTTNFLRADGTWQAAGGGGPCTSTAGAIQYNNSGALGCAAGWTSDGTNIIGASTGALYTTGTGSPSQAAGQTVVTGLISAPSLTTTGGQAWFYNTAANGAVIQGFGSVDDVVFYNKAGTQICNIVTGTTSLTCGTVAVNTTLSLNNSSSATISGGGRSTNGTVQDTLGNSNSGSSAKYVLNLQNNTSSSEGTITLQSSANTGGNGDNSLTFNGAAGIWLQGGGNNGLEINASGNGVLYNQPTTGTITYAVCAAANANGSTGGALILDTSSTVCGLSAKWAKIPQGEIGPAEAAAMLDRLPNVASVWRYKPEIGKPAGQHIGLYADDVADLDKRCANYDDKDGRIKNYEDRCLIALMLAARRADLERISVLEAEIKDLKSFRSMFPPAGDIPARGPVFELKFNGYN
jgi:hypothetical protein